MKVGFMFLLKARFKWVQRLWLTDIFSRENQFASCWDTSDSSGILQWAFQCSVWTQDLQFLVDAYVFFFELDFAFYCELHNGLFSELCFVQRLRVPLRVWLRPGAVETWFLRMLYSLSCERGASPATNLDSRVYNQVLCFWTKSS